MDRTIHLIVLLLVWLCLAPLPSPAMAGNTVRLLTVHGTINPVTAAYLQRNVTAAAHDGDRLLLVELDTPGGLDTAMREIVKAILASPVPVAVYVAPAGARAASAGAVICLAADICAMAPGTTIGAAHPVTIGEKPDAVMANKVLNDAAAYVRGLAEQRGRNPEVAERMVRESLAIPAEQAVTERVADLLATDRAELLQKLDGRQVSHGGREITLRLAGAAFRAEPMGVRERILDAIGNPDVAYVLMMLGFLGLFFEFANPGVILPGVVGGISLILAFFAFQTLPVNYAGVLLILLALVLFVAEIKIVSHGILAGGGVIAMVLGSLFLFDSSSAAFRVSWPVIGVTVLAVSAFFLLVVAKAVQAHRRRPTTGREGLVGETGQAVSAIAPEGRVFIHGEYWDARSDEPVACDEPVTVVAVEGMRLKVKKSAEPVR